MRKMLKIISNMQISRNETILSEEVIARASHNAIQAIKKELPEEAQTVEVMKYIISEMDSLVNEKNIVL